uniref:CCR4-NOT transcription complex subunit 3 n=1 Tax=Trichuris muris TaxID=70415 RepID=A0A5S6QH15_TRIMR
MADKRKLQAEIERCIKKVQEGVEYFDEIWAKVHEAANVNQKEKFEGDLKKEIKKLQRLRDQIKNWQNSNDVKDKTQLCDFRRLIEQKMEQFKIVERETKTKAYSKQGLGSEQKVDPKEKEKEEVIGWLQESIDKLNQRIDLYEGEQEQIYATFGRKKKPEKEKQERLESLTKLMGQHKFHVQKLELILRLLNNSSIEVAKVKCLKDDLDHFIENCEDPTYHENEYMYDDLDLPSAELMALPIGNVVSVNNAETAEPSDTESSQSSSKPSSRPSSRQSSSVSKDSVREVEERKIRYVSESGEVSKLFLGKLESSSKSAPSTPIKMIRQGSEEPEANNSSPSSSAPTCTTRVLSYNAVVTGRRSSQTKPTMAAVVKMNAESRHTISTPTESHQEKLKTTSSTSVSPVPLICLSVENSSTDDASAEVTVDAKCDESAVIQINGPKDESTEESIPSSAKETASEDDQSRLSSDPQTTATADVAKWSSTDNCSTLSDDGSLRSVSAQPVITNSGFDVNDSKPIKLDPTLGCSPLGRLPISPEVIFYQKLLESALVQFPMPSDIAPPRPTLARMPCHTPSYYPQAVPPPLESMDFFMRLPPEILFFIFYYLEGTRAQYFAAKALKKQSWRFHTKYMMWFQRHEEPKTITDEYEQGTYVYFDFEKWAQRKKEGFTFEYRYLEDRDLG